MNDALAILLCLFKLFSSALAFCLNIIKSVINFILSILHVRRINNTNARNRGIVNGGSCSADQVFTPGGQHNYILSGGIESVRNKILKGIIDDISTLRIPVVILHQGNSGLENIFSTSKMGRKVLIINPGHPCYEPLHGRSIPEIASILVNAAPSNYDLKANAEEYIQGLLEYRKAMNGSQKLSWLAECPFSDMFNRLDDKQNTGIISMDQANSIRSKLLAGQSEVFKIRRYIHDLNNQISQIIIPKNGRGQGYSILDCLKQGYVVLIDVLDASNYLAVDLLLKEVDTYAQLGKKLLFVADGIDVQENGALYKLVKAKRHNCRTILSSDDLYALANADEKVFHTLLGNSDRFAIFRHTAASSAGKWSEAIGYYDKIESSTSIGSSQTQQVARFFPLYGSSSTTNYNNKRENIVKQEEITRMDDNEAYIYEGDKSSMSHVFVA